MDLKAIKKKFLTLNQMRLSRTRETLRVQQQDVLDILPLLFHVNHPSLPGYVSMETPVGISNYLKEGQALMAARRLVKGFEYKRLMSHYYDIHAMFLIGSSGTIAHSTKSDFDIWLCHSPSLDTAKLNELREKCEKIEKWADGYNLEMHFFLMNADRFRRGEVLDLSSESSGTAQHDLLLDEFYRTALWLAGRIPMWWLVPPEEEKNYTEYAKNLIERRYLQDGETIDFGGLGHMPAEEFFGAAVWQIYKGVDSPYKSVLKILLMEAYAKDYPDIEFLSLTFKRKIYEPGEISLNAVDPYLMLIDRLTEYVMKNDGLDRIELVRRCFYFKINLPLSKMRYIAGTNWQQDVLHALTKKWDWRLSHLSMLDGRNQWKIERITQERKALVDELTQSYFALSQFARENAGLAMISQRDLTVLGRKLYAAFERKAGKVEIINRGFNSDLHEPLVALVQRRTQGGRETWSMHRGGSLGAPGEEGAPLKRVNHLMELLIWGYFNRLIDRRSAYAIQTHDSVFSDRELHAIIHKLQQLFPGGRLPAVEIDDFANKPRLLSVLLFVNVGLKASSTRARDGHLITDKVDALSFGAAGENLIHSIDVLFVTSWQELMFFHYEEVSGMLDCLCQYLQWSPLGEGEAPPSAQVFCYSSGHGDKIMRRVSELFESVRKAYVTPGNRNLRYVLAVERGYSMLYLEDGMLKHLQLATYEELLEQLGRPQPHYSPLVIDPSARYRGPLMVIYAHDKPGVVQFYFHVAGKDLEVYVLDEKGSLFHQILPLADPAVVLAHYHVFLRAILKRQVFPGTGVAAPERIECYQLKDAGGEEPVLERRKLAYQPPQRCFSVQVIGDPNDSSTGFTVFCDDVEFSTAEYGDALFGEVAKYIMQQRGSGLDYPIYITDIDVPANLLGVEPGQNVQTIHYLAYKKRIEERLNKAAQRAAARNAAP